jgi:ribosomal protein L29
MKQNDLNKQSDKELEKLLLDTRAAVRQFRFDVSGSKAKNLKGGVNLRKDVARIMTELSIRNKGNKK